MNKHVKKLLVKYNGIIVGHLCEVKSNKIAFQYDAKWVENGFSISPFSLPLSNKVYIKEKNSLDGLYGAFFDSLPDGWGNLLLRRKLATLGINYDHLPILTKLSLIGPSGLGALEYEPVQYEGSSKDYYDLDKLAKDAEKLFSSESANVDVEEFYRLGGSSGGSRPKVHIKENNEEWIVKFPCSYDPTGISMEEYRLNKLAKKCDINVNENKLFVTPKGNHYFGAKRFDRKNGNRVHMISLSSLLETSHETPNLDYSHLFQVVLKICPKDDLIEAYKRMCFNVIFQNKDDHGKNFAFVYDENIKSYRLSPFYDITSLPNKFEHEMTVNSKGNPDENDLIEIGNAFNIELEECRLIIRKIKQCQI